MYLPLGVDFLKAWDVQRFLPDKKVASSASEEARRIKRNIARRHLETICRHEEDLLGRVDGDFVDDIYNQLGLPMPMLQPRSTRAKDKGTHDTGAVRDRGADYKAIQLVRSKFHPARTAREQALADLAQLEKQEIEKWMKNVADWGQPASDCGVTRVERAPLDDGMDKNPDAKSDTDYEWPDDDGRQAQWGGSDESDESDESDPRADEAESHQIDGSEGNRTADDIQFECPACDFTSGIPTPPSSAASTPPPSPIICKRELTTDTKRSSKDLDKPSPSPPNITQELAVLLNDKKLLTVYLAGIDEGIKEARKSKAEKDAIREKALQCHTSPIQRPTRAQGQDGKRAREQSRELEEEKPLRWFEYEKMHIYDESSGKWELTMERRGRCYKLDRASDTETLDGMEAKPEELRVGTQDWSTERVPDWAGATGSGWYDQCCQTGSVIFDPVSTPSRPLSRRVAIWGV
ncbi:hypothetical protein SLS53_008742 [Cytospora paraplurivora]|uniref:Uncharacterized protein n=1 Tax=Cytospora paraplurivora TaxID=2898453 RepID=A0AAN9TY67_9PEZI